MSSLSDDQGSQQPDEALQWCLQALDPLRPDYAAAQVYATLALRESWGSWRTRSGLRPGADLRLNLGAWYASPSIGASEGWFLLDQLVCY